MLWASTAHWLPSHHARACASPKATWGFARQPQLADRRASFLRPRHTPKTGLGGWPPSSIHPPARRPPSQPVFAQPALHRGFKRPISHLHVGCIEHLVCQSAARIEQAILGYRGPRKQAPSKRTRSYAGGAWRVDVANPICCDPRLPAECPSPTASSTPTTAPAAQTRHLPPSHPVAPEAPSEQWQSSPSPAWCCGPT